MTAGTTPAGKTPACPAPADEWPPASQPWVGGVLLAGGEARRFGAPKALLDWYGRSFVRHIAGTALAAGLDPLVVVSGAYPAEIQAELSGMKLEIVLNERWAEGQAESLKTGLRQMGGRCEALVFLLVDQPQVSGEVLRALAACYRETRAKIILPCIGGRRANPALFDRFTFAELMQLNGNTGGRALFERYPPVCLDWADETLLLDVDTPEDYRHLLAVTADHLSAKTSAVKT